MSTEAAKAAQRAATRKYCLAHPERVKAAQQRWRAENPEKAAYYRERHREKRSKTTKAWKAANGAKVLAAKRSFDLKKYGLTILDYERLLESQGGGCAICGRKNTGSKRKRYLAVDHCHETGLVRGLLCSQCNTAIGLFKDQIEVIEAAAGYLKRAEMSRNLLSRAEREPDANTRRD
jgi:hypothetical protein